MDKYDAFDLVLDKAADVCHVRKEDIINGSTLHCVYEARVLVVQFLRRYGLTYDDISTIVLRRLNPDPDYFPTIKEVRTKSKSISRLWSRYNDCCMNSKIFVAIATDINDYCRETFKIPH